MDNFSILVKRGVFIFDVADKTVDVIRAPKGEKARTALEKGFEFVGEGVGVSVGEEIVAYSTGAVVGCAFILSGGLAFFVTIPVVVGTSAVVGYMAYRAEKETENKYDNYSRKFNNV